MHIPFKILDSIFITSIYHRKISDRRQNILTPLKIRVRPFDLLEGEGARAGIFLKKEIPGFGYTRGKNLA